MKKVFLTIACLSFVFLLLGAGCGKKNELLQTPDDQTPTTTASPVVRQPASTEPINQAIDFCQTQEYDVVFVFDPTIKTNHMYCEFQKNIGCEVIDYYQGRCVPSTSIAIALPDVEHILFCPDEEEPVCGEDAQTYINQCIANQQQVRTVHDGPCTENDTAVTTPPTPNATDSGTPKQNQPTSGPDGTVNTAWLNPLVNLSSKKTGTRIEACTFGDQTLYYREESCPDCFSTLYNETGNILCFPHNDLNKSCPTFFNKDARSSCKVIWEN